MKTNGSSNDHGLVIARFPVRSLSIEEQFIDRLADLMLDTDELLQMARTHGAASIHWTEAHLQLVYDEINEE